MFVGHLAVAFGAKKLDPQVPLAPLIAASFGLDLLWPVLLLLGIETVRVEAGNTMFTPLAFDSYPWSHSLLMVLLWGSTGGVLAALYLKRARAGLVVGALVVSHWLLDVITHRPDLPLWPGGPELGLGLWNSVPATLSVEGGLLVVGVALYTRAARPRDQVGRWALWALVALTAAIWVSQPWSPPPPSSMAVAVVALFMWTLPVWAGWIDRHRPVVGAT